MKLPRLACLVSVVLVAGSGALAVSLGRAAHGVESVAAALPLPVRIAAPGPVLFGVYPRDNTMDDVALVTHELGRSPAIVGVFSGWATSGFPAGIMDDIRSIGAISEVTWEPFDYTEGVDQPAFSDARIAAGAFDSYLRTWAKAAARWRTPFLLRFAEEMNGDTFPWDAGVNGNTAADYVAAWRHVRAMFAAAGATNAVWVWSPNVIYPGSTPLTALFPGAGEVDVLGMDGYNGGQALPAMGGWRSPGQIFDDTLRQLHSLDPAAPVLITETGSAEAGGSKAAWIVALGAWLRTHPIVRGLLWFDWDKGTDWRIDSSPSATAAARGVFGG